MSRRTKRTRSRSSTTTTWQFTVYRPKELVAGRWHTLLAFAHLSERRDDAAPDDPDPVEEVERQARRILGDTAGYKELTQDSSQAIPREGEITLVPLVEDVEFNPPRRSFLWEEAVQPRGIPAAGARRCASAAKRQGRCAGA
ncbi:MAG: hypothetical protein WDO13_11770 [Verrucomicrobiota bacterium]